MYGIYSCRGIYCAPCIRLCRCLSQHGERASRLQLDEAKKSLFFVLNLTLHAWTNKFSLVPNVLPSGHTVAEAPATYGEVRRALRGGIDTMERFELTTPKTVIYQTAQRSCTIIKASRRLSSFPEGNVRSNKSDKEFLMALKVPNRQPHMDSVTMTEKVFICLCSFGYIVDVYSWLLAKALSRVSRAWSWTAELLNGLFAEFCGRKKCLVVREDFPDGLSGRRQAHSQRSEMPMSKIHFKIEFLLKKVVQNSVPSFHTSTSSPVFISLALGRGN